MTFVRRNRGLVARAVRPWLLGPPTGRAEDYFQAGRLGLWKAFVDWNPTQAAFSTFSFRFIHGEVQREVHRQEFPGISYNDFSLRPAVMAAEAKLLAKLERRPSDEEVAELCEQTPDLVRRVRVARMGPVSAVGTRRSRRRAGFVRLGGVTFPDPAAAALISDEERAAVSATEKAALALETVNARELAVLLRRFGVDGAEPQSFVEIASVVEIGREALRNTEGKALAKAGA